MTAAWRLRLLLALGISLVWAMSARAGWHYEQAAIMGTEITVYLWHDDQTQAELAAAEVMAEMRRVDTWLSPWIGSSELAQLNLNAARAPVVVSEELLLLLNKALDYGDLSGGAFDITFASVGYRYDYRAGRQPDADERARLLPAINYRLVQLDHQRHTVFFAHPDVRIDLGGIAKGYAVDRAVDLLRARGVNQASVSAGGDSRVIGDKRGRPWVVGIKNPRAEDAVALKLPLTDTALSTSGDYERFFIDASGARVHHILNPRTGAASTGVMSVTVLGPLGFDTDPLSTTVFVMGVQAGLALVERLPGFEAIVIDDRGQVHYSSGLQPPVAD
jgi:FAD:protein FMN transferase